MASPNFLVQQNKIQRMEKQRKHEAAANGEKNCARGQNNAEQFYFSKQMQAKTSMIVVLTDGEHLEGVVEWYDRRAWN